jgi:hypothetical protein
MNNAFFQFWSNPDNILNASISQMQQFQEQVMSGLISQKLNFPHMGLMREELDNITETVNAGQDYMTALTKFLQSFSMPYAEGLLEFVKKMKNGQVDWKSLDDKQLYQMAIDVFHQKYDAMLKSEQGQKAVKEVIDQYLDFKNKVNTVNERALKRLAIPTKSEMDDVFKEIYTLKKTNKKQASQIKELTKEVENLKQQMSKGDEQ